MTSSLRADSRALGYKILIAAATVVMTAFLLAVLRPAFTAVSDRATNDTNTSYAATGMEYTQQAWDLLPLLVLIFFMILIVAAAAAETRRFR